MKALRARVNLNNCGECRDELLSECRACGLPIPTGEVISVPERWADHTCPHMHDGLVLKFEGAETNAAEIELETDTESARSTEGEEIEAPEWWNNLDATKGIGYPAREQGRYGSYPSHDGFDDESQP